ncbi:MAG: PHP domain-containing protein [Treponema sp.]|jgi:predicted metal-dependent phosphoesterase TrpH|nr:PHP domain-containing protein [Treponema sp.]
MIDLHTHSTASDGSFQPAELIRAAADKGLRALALTDHDTVDGLAGAGAEAERRGLWFIPGIELEISRGKYLKNGEAQEVSGEFHLLGLGINWKNPVFSQAVADLGRYREARNREILQRMGDMGIEADYEELRSLGGGSIGRPHFAALLLRRGIVKNREQAFAQYLGGGRPLYVPKKGLDFTYALEIIHAAGGIAVLAHPMSLYIAWAHLPGFIKQLAGQGLDGMEAWHPTAKPRICKRLEALGRSLGLIITAGSDFHGAARPDRKLGLTAGGREIGDSYLEGLPARGPLPQTRPIGYDGPTLTKE